MKVVTKIYIAPEYADGELLLLETNLLRALTCVLGAIIQAVTIKVRFAALLGLGE